MIHFEDALKCSIAPLGPDKTILEASLAAGVPHYHQCNGRARCTTCRVRVLAGAEHLSAPDSAEQEVLHRHGLEADIRLACQAAVRGEITISRLIEERPLAIMFCDLRQFTPFAASHLPQDVIYVLNRYFREVCEPIFSHRGIVNQYLGDGFLAVFGLQDTEPTRFCANAARAALTMLERLEVFNSWLETAFCVRFRFGVGLDYGMCVVGKAGHPLQKSFMVLGDAVNRASRIESHTKTTQASILASRDFISHLPPSLMVGPICKVLLKGWDEEVDLQELLTPENSTACPRTGETLEAHQFSEKTEHVNHG